VTRTPDAYTRRVAKVLLIAPTCDGQDVGEAWVAFQWASRLPARHDVTVLTYHKRDRQPATEQLDNLRIVEWAEPPLLGRNERLNSMLKPAYPWFYARARRWIRRAIARGEHFDVAHQVAPVAMRYPSPAANLGIPLVMGPVGGAMESPAGFADDEDSSPWFVRLRKVDRWRFAHDPLLRRTYADSACVLGIAPYVLEQLQNVRIQRFEVMSETALARVPPPTDRSTTRVPVRVLYVGRLVRTKGARDIIRSIPQVRDLPILVDIVGEGPDRKACESLVAELGLKDIVTLHGAAPRHEVDNFYRNADIFVFPSYREAGGNVVPEAMGFALPLIVINRGGPGAATDDRCAIRLSITTPEALAKDLATAIRRLAEDPSLRLAMGSRSRKRVLQHGLWSSKMDEIDRVYHSVQG
jgi:glycosyltransferase involved in cell wall biosynthesis